MDITFHSLHPLPSDYNHALLLFQNCLYELGDMQKKKASYKKLGLKMKEKAKTLEDENRELKAKLEERNAEFERQTNALKAEKLELEGVVEAKDDQGPIP